MRGILMRDGPISISNDLDSKYAPEIARLANDSTIAEFIGGHGFPHPYTTEDALYFFSMNREEGSHEFAIDFIIFLDEKPAGVIGLKDIDYYDGKAHVGYWVGKEFRSKGVASGALKLVCEFSRKTLNIGRLYTKVMENNPASMKVLLRNGFSMEGFERDSFRVDGGYRSMLLLARIMR